MSSQESEFLMRSLRRLFLLLVFAVTTLPAFHVAVWAQSPRSASGDVGKLVQQKAPKLEEPAEPSEPRKPDDNPINGRWLAEIEGLQFLLDLAVYDGDLLGSVTLPDGEKVSITRGICVTDEFSFTTTEKGVEWDWGGLVSESTLEGDRHRFDNDESQEFTAERATN
jgi:hypothetical protein